MQYNAHLSADSIVPGAGPLTLSPHDATAVNAWASGSGGPANPQDLNRYSYTLNNPLNATDPTGHFPILLAIPLLVVSAPAWVVPAAIVTVSLVGAAVVGATLGAMLAEATRPESAPSAPDAGPGAETAPTAQPLSTIPKGGTYVLKDPETGQIMRTGRTNDLERREKEHARTYPDLELDVDARTDSYDEQRGREDYLNQKYQAPLDKVRAVDPKNPNYPRYKEAAQQVQGDY